MTPTRQPHLSAITACGIREMPITTKRHIRISRMVEFAFCVCASVVFTGCECVRENSLTGKLWESRVFTRYNEPSTNADVRFFYSQSREDVLVTYNEIHESGDQVHRR